MPLVLVSSERNLWNLYRCELSNRMCGILIMLPNDQDTGQSHCSSSRNRNKALPMPTFGQLSASMMFICGAPHVATSCLDFPPSPLSSHHNRRESEQSAPRGTLWQWVLVGCHDFWPRGKQVPEHVVRLVTWWWSLVLPHGNTAGI